MRSSSGKNRVEPTFAVAIKRGKISGTFTRAKNSSWVVGFLTITARLSDNPDMYGNGCVGSTARGVNTGKIRS